MPEIEGKVEKFYYTEEKNMFAVYLDGKRYSGFGKPDVKVGDWVKFEFEIKGQWNNIKNDTFSIVPIEEKTERTLEQVPGRIIGVEDGMNDSAYIKQVSFEYATDIVLRCLEMKKEDIVYDNLLENTLALIKEKTNDIFKFLNEKII
jgi:hypothetical protein